MDKEPKWKALPEVEKLSEPKRCLHGKFLVGKWVDDKWVEAYTNKLTLEIFNQGFKFYLDLSIHSSPTKSETEVEEAFTKWSKTNPGASIRKSWHAGVEFGWLNPIQLGSRFVENGPVKDINPEKDSSQVDNIKEAAIDGFEPRKRFYY